MSQAPVTQQQPPEDPPQRLARIWDARPGLVGWLGVVNQQRVGVRFIVTAVVFMLIGGALALLMRTQLAVPDNDFIDPQLYNELFSMHGTTMMFLFAVPVVEGLAIYLLAPMLGNRDLPLTRLTAFGYWCYLFGGILLYSSFLFGVAPDGGWFAYTPLTGPAFSPSAAMDFWLLGVTFVEISAVVTAVEIVVMILVYRPPGMSLMRIPIFAWSMLVTAFMIIFAFPPLIMASILLELDRTVGTVFYDPSMGGNPLLWQHLFWFFGHPEVYIMLLPSVGAVSMIVPVFARRPIVGYLAIVVALVSIGILSFGLWVHHMFTTGQAVLGSSFFTAASLLIAIPSGVQVFAWLATMILGKVAWRAPIKWVAGFFVVFVAGGITGVMVAVVPFNMQVHDTHFVTAHFHYVLIGGMFFPVFAAITYWFPKITGRMMSERAGTISFWLVLIGTNVTFFPLHELGFMGMTRRVYTYASGLGWDTHNLVATIGAFTMALGVAVFIGNTVYSRIRGAPAGNNPWGAGTLEWNQTSPLQPHGPDRFIGVTSREPLWDEGGVVELPEHLQLGDPEPELRETLVTTIIDARPRAINTIPQHSLTPLWVSVAIAISLIGILAEAYWLSVLGVAGGIVALVVWLWPGGPDWGHDHPGHDVLPPTRSVDPDATGPERSVTFYSTVVGMLVILTGFGALLFSYFYLRLDEAAWPPQNLPIPDPVLPGIAMVLLVASGVALWWAIRNRVAERAGTVRLGLLLTAGLGLGAAALTGVSMLQLDMSPHEHAYASVVLVLGWGVVLLTTIGAGVLVSSAIRSLREPLHTGSTAGSDDAAAFWVAMLICGLAGIAVLTIAPHLI